MNHIPLYYIISLCYIMTTIILNINKRENMLKKSYNILNNGKNTLIAINVINKKIKDKVSFSRDDNDLILK